MFNGFFNRDEEVLENGGFPKGDYYAHNLSAQLWKYEEPTNLDAPSKKQEIYLEDKEAESTILHFLNDGYSLDQVRELMQHDLHQEDIVITEGRAREKAHTATNEQEMMQDPHVQEAIDINQQVSDKLREKERMIVDELSQEDTDRTLSEKFKEFAQKGKEYVDKITKSPFDHDLESFRENTQFKFQQEDLFRRTWVNKDNPKQKITETSSFIGIKKPDENAVKAALDLAEDKGWDSVHIGFFATRATKDMMYEQAMLRGLEVTGHVPSETIEREAQAKMDKLAKAASELAKNDGYPFDLENPETKKSLEQIAQSVSPPTSIQGVIRIYENHLEKEREKEAQQEKGERTQGDDNEVLIISDGYTKNWEETDLFLQAQRDEVARLGDQALLEEVDLALADAKSAFQESSAALRAESKLRTGHFENFRNYCKDTVVNKIEARNKVRAQQGKSKLSTKGLSISQEDKIEQALDQRQDKQQEQTQQRDEGRGGR